MTAADGDARERWLGERTPAGGSVRIVAHVDMDAFYAAVEAQRDPSLRDRPLVVGADPKDGHGRGVVTAASYTARRYGIRSALPISRAWRLAEAARRRGEPETIFVRDDHALYRAVSERIMRILAAAGDAFQKTSVDEAYLDLSSLGSFDAAVERARRIKVEIVTQEGLTASVGIGPNKLVAKIASDFQKPDGLTVVRPEQVQGFLDPLRIRVIPGIGPKTEQFLHERHIRTVAELRAVDREQLAEWFGRWGEDLFAKARGVSDSAISNERERKSVGEQETFEVDTLDAAFVQERVRALARTVWARLAGHGFQGFRTVTVTVRFENFTTSARSRTGREPWTSEEALSAAALELLLPFLDDRENPRHRKLRLVGVRAEKLSREPTSSGGRER
jgi:DNA polymerase IV (DinB-like DNA polymerase)